MLTLPLRWRHGRIFMQSGMVASLSKGAKSLRVDTISTVAAILCREMFPAPTPRWMPCANCFGAIQKSPGFDVYVVRVNSLGVLQESMPCIHCAVLLKRCGVRRIFCSARDHTVKRWRVDDLIQQSKPSNGWR